MDSSEFFTLNSNYRETRKLNPYKLHISYCRVDTKNYFLSKRIETVWNRLKARDNGFTSLSSLSYCCDEAIYLNSWVYNNFKFVLSS